MRHQHAGIVARVAALLLTGGIAIPGASAADLEKSKVDLAVGGKTLIVYLPLTIAERRGLFAKEGLTVEVADFQGGAKALQALVGGSTDIVSGAYEHTLHMAAVGQEIKAIALQDTSFGLVVGVQNAKAASYKSIESLKGMTVGVTSPGSASSTGLAMLLGKAGLGLKDVSVIGVGAGASAVAAMKAGKIDAIANFDPVISVLERDKVMKVILDTRQEKDLVYLYGAPFAASAFYTTTRFITRYPKTTQAFANAVSSALDWISKATTDEIVAAVPAEYYGSDKALYHSVVESNRARFSTDGRISAEAAQLTYRNLSAYEDSLKGKAVNVADTYDNSFIERALSLRSR